MTPRRISFIAGAALLVIVIGFVIRNQIEVHRGRLARQAAMQQRHPVVDLPPEVRQYRQALFDILRPVGLGNCDLRRFGERHDGGYPMCANLLAGVQSGYSYGINGYDE